ncbi:MAG: hypothetical protein RLZZ142_1922 [Verrucomicrobiota bacterium]
MSPAMYRAALLALFSLLLLLPQPEAPAQGNAFLQAKPAAGSLPSPSECTASLVPGTTAIAPGSPFPVLVRFELAKDWHLYWQFPGDSGAAPSVRWELPEGFSVSPVRWPLPQSLSSQGALFTNVYHEELLLPFLITPPASLSGSEFTFKASLKWFVCSETCLPGKAELSLRLPAGTPSDAHADLFKKAQAQLPLSSPPPFQIQWSREKDALLVSLQGVPAGNRVELFPIPPQGLTPEHPAELPADSPANRRFRIPIAEPDPAGTHWSVLVVLNAPEGPRQGWEVPLAQAAAPTSASVPTKPAQQTPTPSAPSRGLANALWGAFIGGLLLNLMPCVLPVIALKIFGFTQQAGQDPRKVLRLGLAFTAGVFAFFLALAGAVIVLKAAGGSLNWGFQFQNPWVLVGLLSAVFAFGLNLLGVFEITLSSGATARMSALSGQHGYGGAFLHGLFTTLLGTSCTAPYLGVTLGFAVSQPPTSVILLFLTIALGMSLPYLLLTTNPALLRFLPKPGLWMERLKQGMGFVMLGVAVWLLNVLGTSRGAEAVSATCSFLLGLGLACWLLGTLRSRLIALLLALGITAAGFLFFLKEPLSQTPTQTAAAAPGSLPWVPFSPERVASERAAGHPVFVDFTADWCLNCKVNERGTLSKPEVMEAFRKAGVVLMKADWTHGDPVVTAELHRFQRIAVPFYLLYPAREGDPVILPELLTPSLVMEAVRKLP